VITLPPLQAEVAVAAAVAEGRAAAVAVAEVAAVVERQARTVALA
jgi:hypothetical protein